VASPARTDEPGPDRTDRGARVLAQRSASVHGTSGYVLGLVCLITARGLLYRSKPSIEVTNVNARTPDCKAGQSRPFRPVSSAPDGAGALKAHPGPASPTGIQVSGRNAVQLRSCGGRIRRFFGRLAHRCSLRTLRAKCGVTSSGGSWMPSPQKACKLVTTVRVL
jgi:hypothetical protein